jgi:hypothetical protein
MVKNGVKSGYSRIKYCKLNECKGCHTAVIAPRKIGEGLNSTKATSVERGMQWIKLRGEYTHDPNTSTP